MTDISGLPPMTIETAASMQEQLARRDHRIAVLEAIVAAKTARIAELEARERVIKVHNVGELMAVLERPEGATPSHSLALSRAIASDKPLDAYGRR